jgi:hypothetical protein
MPLPESFQPGTTFTVYRGTVPLSRDRDSFVITAWDVAGGRPFSGELYDFECELVSEAQFRSRVGAALFFRRYILEWAKQNTPVSAFRDQMPRRHGTARDTET